MLSAVAVLTSCRAEVGDVVRGATTEEVVPLVLEHVAEPDTVLSGIRDVVLSGDHIWLASVGAIPLAHYGLETLVARYPGAELRTGPTPIREVFSLDVNYDGTALVWDGPFGRLIRVSSDWQTDASLVDPALVQTLMTPGWDFLGGKRNQVLAMANGVVFGKLRISTAGSGDFDRTRFVQLRSGLWDTVLAFEGDRGGLDSALAGPRLFGPFPLVARCGRSSAAVYYPDQARIEMMDSLWHPSRSVGVKRVPPTRTDEMARELFVSRMLISARGTMTDAEIRKLLATAPIGAIAGGAARRMPAYSRLVCTPAGTVLIERFRIATLAHREPNIWEVYRPDGSEMLLQMPPRFRLFDANDEHLVGVVTDSLDVPSVARARWPK